MAVSRAAGVALSLLAWTVGVPLAHGVVPWLLSGLGPRYGWRDASPSALNALGLVPLALGAALLFWVLVSSLARLRDMPERVALDWSPKLLLASGPYRVTRNPMYVGELALWLGWAWLFGSPVVLAAALPLAVGMVRTVRREERDLAQRFGDDYARYAASVPRWLRFTLRHARE